MLNSLHLVWARRPSIKVDNADSPLVPTSTMSHSYPASVVSPALPMAFLGKGQFEQRPALPQLVCNRSSKMPSARRGRLVATTLDGFLLEWRRRNGKFERYFIATS